MKRLARFVFASLDLLSLAIASENARTRTIKYIEHIMVSPIFTASGNADMLNVERWGLSPLAVQDLTQFVCKS